MPNEFAERGILPRLSMLCNKIVLILLKYNEGKELSKKEKEALLRGKDLILDKLTKFAELIEGDKIKDESGLWERMKLYGYALAALHIFKDNSYFETVIFNSSGLKISNFFKVLSRAIDNISTCKEPICSGWMPMKFFESFEEQIRPHRLLFR